MAALSIAFTALPTLASATAITFSFNGTVTTVNSLVGGTFTTGDSMSGSLTYDSALSDTDASADGGLYAPLSSFAMDIDGYGLTFVNGSGSIDVQNGPPGSDSLVFTSDVTGSAVGSFRPFRVFLSLADATGLALTDDDLPSAFNSTQFAVKTFIVSFTNRTNPNDTTSPGTNFTGVSGILTGGGAEAAAVVTPEPATLSLFGTGVAALAVRLRRRRRASNPGA